MRFYVKARALVRCIQSLLTTWVYRCKYKWYVPEYICSRSWAAAPAYYVHTTTESFHLSLCLCGVYVLNWAPILGAWANSTRRGIVETSRDSVCTMSQTRGGENAVCGGDTKIKLLALFWWYRNAEKRGEFVCGTMRAFLPLPTLRPFGDITNTDTGLLATSSCHALNRIKCMLQSISLGTSFLYIYVYTHTLTQSALLAQQKYIHWYRSIHIYTAYIALGYKCNFAFDMCKFVVCARAHSLDGWEDGGWMVAGWVGGWRIWRFIFILLCNGYNDDDVHSYIVLYDGNWQRN